MDAGMGIAKGSQAGLDAGQTAKRGQGREVLLWLGRGGYAGETANKSKQLLKKSTTTGIHKASKATFPSPVQVRGTTWKSNKLELPQQKMSF